MKRYFWWHTEVQLAGEPWKLFGTPIIVEAETFEKALASVRLREQKFNREIQRLVIQTPCPEDGFASWAEANRDAYEAFLGATLPV